MIFFVFLSISDISIVEEFKNLKKLELLNAKLNETKNKQFAEGIGEIVKGVEFEIRDKLSADEAENSKKERIPQIEQNGLIFDMFKQTTGLDDD